MAMRCRVVCLIATAGSVLGDLTMTTTSPVAVEPLVEGMKAWGDIPGSKFVDIPDFLTAAHMRMLCMKGSPKPGAEFNFECKEPKQGRCDLYVFLYRCPGLPCTVNGGLHQPLDAAGFKPSSCAPKFTLGGSQRHPMAAYRKQLKADETLTFSTTASARYIAMAFTDHGYHCAAAKAYHACMGMGSLCSWDDEKEVCEDAWCQVAKRKKKRFQGPVKPTECLTCPVPRPEEDPDKGCARAFARTKTGVGSTCFLDHPKMEAQKKWGWVNTVAKTDTLVLYKGAENCDTTAASATVVGWVKIVSEHTTLRVEFVPANGYSFAEANLFVGKRHKLPDHNSASYTALPIFSTTQRVWTFYMYPGTHDIIASVEVCGAP